MRSPTRCLALPAWAISASIFPTPTRNFQAPKMAPHIGQMIAHVAADLGVETQQVNLKAKTNEKLGYLGREEGIAAEAVALIYRN
jgi:2-C-methyl-D-erythritol 2,4-cyclodiphosphate synthase